MPAASFSDSSLARFRDGARAWLTKVAPAYQAAMREAAGEDQEIAVRRAWEAELYRGGYACLSWPGAFGGRGLGPIEEFVFSQECSSAGAPTPLGRVGQLLAGPAIFVHGSAEQKARFLPKIVAGEETWCQGFSEPDAGSDLASVRTRATLDGDHYVIQGQKIWTSFGHYADWCLLLARTGAASNRYHNLTLFAVPMRQDKIDVRTIRQISGRSQFSEVFYDDALVPVSFRIGDENDGWRVAMTIMSYERGGGFGALALQWLDESLDLLRSHCGAKILVLHPKVAALQQRVNLVRWQIMRSIEQAAAGRDASPSSSIMKLTWSELLQDIVRVGFLTNCVEHLARWRFLVLAYRSESIASGTAEIQRNIIAQRVLGLPR